MFFLTTPRARVLFRAGAPLCCAALVLAGVLLSGCSHMRPWKAKPFRPQTVDEILALISEPQFAARDFSIRDFGATAEDAKPAIDKAIAACNEAGGGRVVVPAGDWLVKGPIHLKSNVNLYTEKGATIRFSTDPKDYPNVRTRWEGNEVLNYSPLIYAFEQTNIGVTGQGVFDGQGAIENWWGWARGRTQKASADVEKLRKASMDNVPLEERVFGVGSHLRPNFFSPYRCKNIIVEGVTFKNSPMWFLHPTLSENIIIRKVTTIGHGPNNDGCDPESCKNLLIEGCYFDNGDDCIAIKSGRDDDGRRFGVPTENVVIRDCIMKDGHGGVVLGSELSGGIRNVIAENCQMDSPNLQRALRIKSNSYRGGFVENVRFRNMKVGQLADEVFLIEMFYSTQRGTFYPRIEDVLMENVTVKNSPRAFNFTGVPQLPIKNITVRDCVFEKIEERDIISNIEGFTVQNVKINGLPRERTPGGDGRITPAKPAAGDAAKTTQPTQH